MASNYTSNYNLCQWAASDKVLRTEFNADNAKIDAALASINSGKASASALNTLNNTVSSLSATVSAQGNTLTKKGNCQIAVTSYTGNGQNTRTHTFSKMPVMFFIIGETLMFVGAGATWAKSHGTNDREINVAWSGNSVTFSISSTSGNLPAAVANVSGKTYQIIALYDQSV